MADFVEILNIFFILFIFYLLYVDNKNIFKVNRKNNFPLKRKC